MKPDYESSEEQNPYRHIRKKSNEEWYLFWLCEDPEFIDEVWTFFDWAVEGGLQLDQAGYALHEKQVAERYEAILSKYRISKDELETILAGYHQFGDFDHPFNIIRYEKYEVIVGIPINIKREDYINGWSSIEKMLLHSTVRDKNLIKASRQRNPSQMDLVYAIFKAQQSGKTLHEAFDLYDKSALPDYDNSQTNTFEYFDSFKKHYYRYKPDR